MGKLAVGVLSWQLADELESRLGSASLAARATVEPGHNILTIRTSTLAAALNRWSSKAFKDITSCALPHHIHFLVVKLSQAMAFGNLWHALKHRVGFVKSATFLSAFVILYAIALSSFIKTANNLNAEASFRQPKQPNGKSLFQ